MTLAFILTMPGVASWNGKWSGKGKLYAITRKFSSMKPQARAHAVLKSSPYHYRWDDGWAARVDVRPVDGAELRLIKRESQGFCGYDWMVDRIITHGEILADHELPENQKPEPVEAS